MAKRTYRPEEIVSKLRQANAINAQGTTIPNVVGMLGVFPVRAYRTY